jgi:hypothetical protein
MAGTQATVIRASSVSEGAAPVKAGPLPGRRSTRLKALTGTAPSKHRHPSDDRHAQGSRSSCGNAFACTGLGMEQRRGTPELATWPGTARRPPPSQRNSPETKHGRRYPTRG